jgi:hypothetical protein
MTDPVDFLRAKLDEVEAPSEGSWRATRKMLEIHYPTLPGTECTLCGWGEPDDGRDPSEGYWPCPTLRLVAEMWGWHE